MTTISEHNQPVSQNLAQRYRDVMFSSIITSCGLDLILFSNDEVNGHVDTINNIANSTRDGGKPTFKSQHHSDAYENRGSYNSAQYHSDQKYIDKGKIWNKQRDEGNLKDAYTGKTIKPGEKYDRDHVVPAKAIHDDPRRALSGLNGVELANQDSNLWPTNPSINRSKQADSSETFIAKLTQQRDTNLTKAKNLRSAIELGSAPEGAHKQLEALEQKLLFNEGLLREATSNAEKAISRRHNTAYYTSKDFIGTTSHYALAAGFKMGAKQGLGIILLELSVAMQEEFPAILRRWQKAPTWTEKLDLQAVLNEVASVLRNAWERVKNKLGYVFSQVKSGFAAGILSEIVTTVINIFTGTAKKVMKMLRSFWSAIISSLQILIHNPDNYSAEEKLAAVMRIFSVAIGAVIQPIICEVLDKLLLTHATLLPPFVREVLSGFAGAAVGGIISVTLVYAIDNSPVVSRVIEVTRKIGELTEAVYQQIAQIVGVTWEGLKSSVETITNAANSPVVNLAAFIACPPLGVAVYFNRRLNHIESSLGRMEEGQVRIESKLEGLDSTMRTGFASIEHLVHENTALLRCVADGQEHQMTMLIEIRNELRTGFGQIREVVGHATRETAELVAVQRLQENIIQLSESYRDCANALRRGESLVRRDLESIEELARSLISKLQTRFNDQKNGAPARLPLLIGMTLALGIWRDARSALGDDTNVCFERARIFTNLISTEIHALTRDVSFWQLLQEENSWLTGQYVLLRRTLLEMPSMQRTFEIDTDDNYLLTTLPFALVGWNDGLQNARDLIEQMKAEPPLSVLVIKTFEDRQAWQKLMGLPRGMSINEVPIEQLRHRLGIPAEISLGSSALELMRQAPALIESHRNALAHEFF